MDDDIRWVILHRVTWRNTMTMPGSTVVMANCGHRSWIAPSSVTFLGTDEGREAYTICTDCMPHDFLNDADTKVAAVPGSSEEFAALFGTRPDDEAAIRAFLRRGRP